MELRVEFSDPFLRGRLHLVIFSDLAFTYLHTAPILWPQSNEYTTFGGSARIVLWKWAFLASWESGEDGNRELDIHPLSGWEICMLYIKTNSPYQTFRCVVTLYELL